MLIKKGGRYLDMGVEERGGERRGKERRTM